MASPGNSPEIDLLLDQLCYPIYGLSNTIRRTYKVLLEELELTYPQYLVLLILAEEGVVSLSTICERISIAPGALSPVITRMKANGIVSKRRNPNSDRMVEIELTDLGRAKVAALATPQKTLSKLWRLNKQEVKELRRLLATAQGGLDAFLEVHGKD